MTGTTYTIYEIEKRKEAMKQSKGKRNQARMYDEHARTCCVKYQVPGMMYQG